MQFVNPAPGSVNSQLVMRIPSVPVAVSSGDEFQFPLPEGTVVASHPVQCQWKAASTRRRPITPVNFVDAKRVGMRVSYLKPMTVRDFDQGEDLTIVCTGFTVPAGYTETLSRYFITSQSSVHAGTFKSAGPAGIEGLAAMANMEGGDGC